MNKALEEQIYAIDPVFFRQKDLDMTQTCMCWGIECGDGWFEPIKKFVECVALLNKMCQPFGVAIVADQIKSKWADFTCYWNIVPLDEDSNSSNENDRQIDCIYHLMDAAVAQCEDECSHTCELCGKHSIFEDEVFACGSWLTVKCLDCAQERQRKSGVITSFNEGFMFLSPFAEQKVQVEEITYPTFLGAYYGACDKRYEKVFQNIRNPRDAQNVAYGLGLCVANNERIEIMERMLKLRYEQSDRARKGLLSTDGFQINSLNNSHENFWGSCVCDKCNQSGANRYGKLLMQIRDELLKND